MADIINIIDEVRTSCSTPEKALQLLDALPSANSLKPESDEDPTQIFLSYFSFFMKNRSNGSIVGIWDELLCKITKYTKDVVIIGRAYGAAIGAHSWLDPILRSNVLCPNPYTRLELFRLGRLFGLRIGDTDTFIKTIRQIKPHRFYPSGNSDDLLFDAIDLHYILIKCADNILCIRVSLTFDINKQVDNGNEFIICDFLLNCIHLLEIFASKSSNIDDQGIRTVFLDHCCVAFLDGVCQSVSNISDIICKQPYLHHVIEFIRNISVGAATLRHAAMCYETINIIRTRYVSLPETQGKSIHLPKLLFNRHIHESRYIQQNYLLDSTLKYYMALKQPFSIIEKLLSLESTLLDRSSMIRSIRDDAMDTSLSDSYSSGIEEETSDDFSSEDNM